MTDKEKLQIAVKALEKIYEWGSYPSFQEAKEALDKISLQNKGVKVFAPNLELETVQDQLEMALKEIKSIKGVKVELLHDYIYEAHRLVKKLNNKAEL